MRTLNTSMEAGVVLFVDSTFFAVMVKCTEVPLFSSDSIQIPPPIRSVSLLQMQSPRPVPP